MSITHEQIILFRSYFRGRNDVFAIRWEKEDKSGYMPAYNVDWSDYQVHKANGGTFKDYSKKEFCPFDDEAIISHLTGKETIGIYPLLEDNTSFFIAADFDNQNWEKSLISLFSSCRKYQIPAYIERSRSGNGGHLWVFFDENLPAVQTRKVMFELLRDSGIISQFEKEPSFDRLFPNQDYHSGKGLGNLIALPLNAKTRVNGNSIFLDPDSLEPFSDQNAALKSFRKLSREEFRSIFEVLFNQAPPDLFRSNIIIDHSPEIVIQISNQVSLKRLQLSRKIITFLRENLNFFNADYLVLKNLGKSTYKTEKYFRLIEEKNEEIIIPRGFAAALVNFCKKENLAFKIIDNRKKLEPVSFDSSIVLLPHQKNALEKTADKDFGVIISPPGSGKTIMGLEIIAQKQQPALILVHRKQLFDQWIDRIQSFLKIPKGEIGQIGNQKFTIGSKITVAMIQSLNRMEDMMRIGGHFGTIIVDECHHVPAKSFREVIVNLNSYYLYGLTATPIRKNNDEKLIYYFIGNIIYEASQDMSAQRQILQPEVNIRLTNLFAPFDYKIDNYETISRILIHDTQRNNLILSDIEANINRFRSILVLTERKAHVEILNLYLKDRYETITIHGDHPEQVRKSRLEQIKQGHCKIIISTGQFFGEGIDLNNLECLFITYPFAFEGKLVQYIGRIQRSGKQPVIFDYHDSKIDYFDKMFKQRNRYYRRLLKKT